MIANNFVIFVSLLIAGFGQFCEGQVFAGGECLDVETVNNFDVQRIFVQLAYILSYILLTHPGAPYMITGFDLTNVKKVKELLQAFENVTREISVDSYVTVSKVIRLYMGEWFEYKKYPSDLEKNNKCGMDVYELRDTGDVTILKSQYNTFSKSYVELVGTASNVENGRINVQFKDVAAAARSRFWIVDTDYTNYSVLYACTPITDHYHSKMVWIMTREQNPKAVSVVRAYQTLARNRLPISYLKDVQQDCSRKTGILDKVMQFISKQ